MTTIKIERKEEKRRAIKIAHPNTEDTSAEEKTEILETEERKTDCMMIIMRGISTTASVKIEEEERKEERNDGIGTMIRGGATAKTDRKEEAREMKTATGEEIRAKRDQKKEVKGTSIAIGSVGIVITGGKGPRRMRMIRDTGTDRTSIKENGERKKEMRELKKL